MTMARINLVVQDGAGSIINGASVEVRTEAPGAALAAIKPNRDGSGSLGNPFVAADGADAGFFVAAGAYKVRVYTGPSGAPTFERIQRYEANGTAAECDVTTFTAGLLGAADAAAARTSLGLGTAAVQNTGTSGANVPLLNGVNTWSGVQTFSANNVAVTGGAVTISNVATPILNFRSSTGGGAVTAQFYATNGYWAIATAGVGDWLHVFLTNGDTEYYSTTDATSSTTGAFKIAGGLGVAKALFVGTTIKPGSYTVATLPAGSAGMMVYCSNVRVFNGAGTQEGAGVGTGGLVVYSNSNWKIAGTNVTAVA